MRPIQIIFNLCMFAVGIIAIWVIPPSFYQIAFWVWFGIDLIVNSVFDYRFPNSHPQQNYDELSKFQVVLRTLIMPITFIGGSIAAYHFFAPNTLFIRVLLTLLFLVLIIKLVSDLRKHQTSRPRPA